MVVKAECPFATDPKATHHIIVVARGVPVIVSTGTLRSAFLKSPVWLILLPGRSASEIHQPTLTRGEARNRTTTYLACDSPLVIGVVRASPPATMKNPARPFADASRLSRKPWGQILQRATGPSLSGRPPQTTCGRFPA